MQSGRNNRLDGRVPIPINRGTAGYLPKPIKNVESEKKKHQMGATKPGATSVINLPEDGRIKPARKATNVSNIPKARPIKVDENRVSQSIQKLLSVYENGEKSNVGKVRTADERKGKLYGKPSRYNVTRIPPVDKTHGKKVGPVSSDKAKTDGVEMNGKGIRSVEENRKIPQRRKATPEDAKPIDSITESMIITTVKKNSEEVTSEADTQSNQLIPIMTPEHRVEAPVNIINTIINPDDRPLDFLLTGCDDKSVFPVCSKRATDNIPSSEATSVSPEPPDKSDLIIMLRRRNSEPYSPKNCLLQCPEADSWNNPTIQNYYFWEPGPTRQLRPYWEVSLFKSNRSLSVLTSRAASRMLSLTPSNGNTEILQSGRFRRAATETTKPSWLREASSITDDHIQTMPFITLMEKGRILPREPEIKPENHPEESQRRQPRVFSKDDQYKPPGHLLVYVKSSQKKLVTVESSESHPEKNGVNKKVHKLTKISRTNSDVRQSPWHRKILVTATTAILVIVGAFAFLLYFLTKRHSVFNLTPPIPGLVRGC